MTRHSSEARPRAHLFLGDRPRLEIPLAAAGPGSPPTWLGIGLPRPTAQDRPEGRFLADPRIPESEVVFGWGTSPAVGRALRVLTITFAGETWLLEEDLHDPERWVLQADVDSRRHWS